MRVKAGKVVAAGSGVLVLAVGLGLGTTGAGAATDANFAFARTQGSPVGVFGLVWGSGTPFGVSFNTRKAVNFSFRVNGVTNFSVPAVYGNVSDPSYANATSINCVGCLTNAIAISIDVVSGPITSVYAPTNAVINMQNTSGSNALAVDFTFVVSPGVQASLTPAGLSALAGIASQLNADANAFEPSTTLANQVIDGLNQIATILSNPSDLDPSGPTPVAPGVQRFGGIQYTSS